jgi:hypothetical protein
MAWIIVTDEKQAGLPTGLSPDLWISAGGFAGTGRGHGPVIGGSGAPFWAKKSLKETPAVMPPSPAFEP